MCKALLYEVQAAVVRSPRNRRNRLRKDRFQDWGLGPLPFQGRVCSSSAAVVCLGVGLILHGLSFFKRYIRFLYINISIFAIIFAISFILFFQFVHRALFLFRFYCSCRAFCVVTSELLLHDQVLRFITSPQPSACWKSSQNGRTKITIRQWEG